jgi:hypothetical protein
MELWTRKLDIRTRRAVILTGLSVLLACLANEWLGWGVFNGFDHKATVVSFILGGVLLYFFWIDPDETRAYRASKRRRQ